MTDRTVLSVAAVTEARDAVFSVASAKSPPIRSPADESASPYPFPVTAVALAACCAAVVTAAVAAAPVHQATHYYREGQYTSCSACWQDFKTSIAAKMCKDEAEAQVGQRRRFASPLPQPPGPPPPLPPPPRQ